MNTKLIIALVLVGVLAVAVVGLVSAQIATSAAENETGTGGPQPYYGAPAYAASPANITVTDLYTNQTPTYPYYGYGYGYGYGPCMGGFFP